MDLIRDVCRALPAESDRDDRPTSAKRKAVLVDVVTELSGTVFPEVYKTSNKRARKRNDENAAAAAAAAAGSSVEPRSCHREPDESCRVCGCEVCFGVSRLRAVYCSKCDVGFAHAACRPSLLSRSDVAMNALGTTKISQVLTSPVLLRRLSVDVLSTVEFTCDDCAAVVGDAEEERIDSESLAQEEKKYHALLNEYLDVDARAAELAGDIVREVQR